MLRADQDGDGIVSKEEVQALYLDCQSGSSPDDEKLKMDILNTMAGAGDGETATEG